MPDPRSNKSVGFLPGGAAVPETVRTGRVVLRPLRTTDVETDYDAVRSSAPELRRWSESDWPADDFTLADDLADLEQHEREHVEQLAFTYTVLDPSERRCLGCVYIVPVCDAASGLCAGWTHAACVGFWVRASEIAADLDRHLLATLLRWFRTEWPFDGVLFTNATAEERQAMVLAEVGLERRPLRWPDGRSGWAFRASQKS